MFDNSEQPRKLSPFDILTNTLAGEAAGSPKVLAIADHFSLLKSEVEIYYIRTLSDDTSLELLMAIAERAQIQETIRNRKIGIHAVEYNQVDISAIYGAYHRRHSVSHPSTAGFGSDQCTSFKVAEAVLTDLSQYLAQ